MALSNISNNKEFSRANYQQKSNINASHINTSTVSWAAIFAGATAAAALSLILLLLGAGLGLSSISPWMQRGISTTAFSISTIVWIAVTQVLAAGMGGYIAGRLRNRWIDTQADEIYFRDTAHGFLTWSVATLASAVIITSTIGSIISSGLKAPSTLTGAVATATLSGTVSANDVYVAKSDNTVDSGTIPILYFVDSMFRSNANVASAISTANITSQGTLKKTALTSEVIRILVNSMKMRALPPEDLTYISQLVSMETGLTKQEAEIRVHDIYKRMLTNATNVKNNVRDSADKARKASIYATLWLFVSLLMGAFSASLAATWGGRCRDS